MGCTNSLEKSSDDTRHMSPVATNNNNNRNGDSGGDHDGEGESDFLFFIEMESDSDEVGQGQSKCFNTILHLQNVKSPLYTKTSGKIQLQLHFCENYSIILCLSITSNVKKIIIQG